MLKPAEITWKGLNRPVREALQTVGVRYVQVEVYLGVRLQVRPARLIFLGKHQQIGYITYRLNLLL